MIVGIGIDLCRIERIRDACERHGDRFIRRILTEEEREYCFAKKSSWESIAARFAAKEAAFKALGRGWDSAGGFRNVEVTRKPDSAPVLVLHGKAKEFAEALGVTASFLSITHDSGTAAAVVVLESGK